MQAPAISVQSVRLPPWQGRVQMPWGILKISNDFRQKNVAPMVLQSSSVTQPVPNILGPRPSTALEERSSSAVASWEKASLRLVSSTNPISPVASTLVSDALLSDGAASLVVSGSSLPLAASPSNGLGESLAPSVVGDSQVRSSWQVGAGLHWHSETIRRSKP